MKIFIFSSVHIWNDTRVFRKQAISLSKKHDVELHAPAEFEYKKINGVKIFGLPKWENVSDRKKIRKELWERIKQSDADFFHFHDPELLWMGLKIKFLLSKIVIYDVHEHYPKAILDKSWLPNYLRKLVSVSFDLFERISTRFIDYTIYTTEIIGKRFPKKTSGCINNYPILNIVKDAKADKIENQLVYVGGISKIRGIYEIVKAIKLLVDKGHKKINLYLIGKFQTETLKKDILKLIKDENLQENIIITGHLPYEEIFSYISSSEIGLVTYLPFSNNVVCIPNKIFEYMLAGTTVLASNFPLYRKIIKKSNGGKIVDPTKPEKIAATISDMLKDKNKLAQMSQDGKQAVQTLFNWDIEERRLFSIYESLAKE